MVADESSWRRLACIAALAFGIAGTSLGAAPTSLPAPFPDAASPEMRVAATGYRLATRARALCPRTSPVIGLLLHEPGSYPVSVRAEMTARFGMEGGIGIRGVVVGSAAERAGLTAGDVLLAVNGRAIGQLNLPPLRPAASYDRVQSFVRDLTANLAAGLVTLELARGADRRTVTLAPDIGCAAPTALVPGSKPDAWSDTNYAAVTEGLAAVSGDDELAFALAHEMAHVVLRHAAESHGMLTGIGIGGKRSRDREREADRLGVMMTIAAGYSPSGARELLTRFARVNALPISLTHPSVRARLEAIEQTQRQYEGRTVAP